VISVLILIIPPVDIETNGCFAYVETRHYKMFVM